MLLSDEEYDVIEQMAACNYKPAKIALYLGVDKIKFMSAWLDRKSQVRYHYERGILQAEFEISRKRLENAMSGNLTADQQHQKELEKTKFENIKQELLYCSSTPIINTDEPKKIAETGAGRPD